MEHQLEIVAEEKVRQTIAEAGATGQHSFDCAAKVLQHVSVERVAATEMPEAVAPHGLPSQQPFGEWLLVQKDPKGWICELSRALKPDRNFPRRGDPDDIGRYPREVRAEDDAYVALDDADLAWASN